MILQALKEYYDRKAADPDSGIAPLGWEWKEIPYIFVLSEDGKLVRIEDTREKVGKRVRAKPFLVPQSVVRTRNPAAFLLWDKAEYAFPGVATGTDALKKHALFRENLEKFKSHPLVASVIKYLRNNFDINMLSDNQSWTEYVQSGAVATFRISSQNNIIVRDDAFVGMYDGLVASLGNNSQTAICLVTGKHDTIARTHHKIVGVVGTDKNRGSLISFNWDAAESFGKEQSFNSPVGAVAEFAYTTALNALLSKDSKQKMQVGDATTVFWASERCPLEDEFADIFGEPQKDNPDRGVDAVERLLSSVRTGAFAHDGGETRFYVLGLSPNSARISVRFWHEGTVAEMERRFADWFESLRIAHGANDKEHLSLWRLLVAIAPLGKSENIPSNLAGAVMRSILDGTPLPVSLLPAALVRIKAERDVTYARAKLIKAFLIRNHKRNITMNINKTNPSIGERLGQLFAMLEKIQQAANPSINTTIRDKFYASASATPATVFGNLMRLSGHHLSKLDSDKKGLRIWFEKQVEEIMSGVNRFPPHLSLEEQGMFAIGYYHQRIAKKDDEGSSDSAETV